MSRRTPPFLGAVAAAVAAVLVLGVARASAADVTLSARRCFSGGGQIAEPAGSTIAIRFLDAEFNRGMLQDFLAAQRTTLTLNGGAPIDVSSLYETPSQVSNGEWVSSWTYPTGITLAQPGDTLTFTLTITLSRRLAEELNGPVGAAFGFAPGRPIFSGPGVVFTGSCIVTAV